MQVEIKNEKQVTLPEGSSGRELAEMLHLHGPEQALAMMVNGLLKDLCHPLSDGDIISFVHFSDKLGREVFWHTSAHVLAQAILRLYPEAKPTIGPPIESGFYYDFANLSISAEDFEKIEKEMQKIISENIKPERSEFASKKEALSAFQANPYKCEIINAIPDGEPLTAYRQNEFFDLCRGPHLDRIGKIKALKVMKCAGAYWRGDAKNEMLTRVYAITFPDRKQLKTYLEKLEEAKKRDHKILGPKLDLFSLKEEAPGMPFIHPKGMVLWNGLCAYLRTLLAKNAYVEIKTPHMMVKELWERSGHWKNYRQHMFTSEVEDREFAIKPMNCPGCMLYYKGAVHSYRELPLRVAEIGNVHRFEPSGALSGLFRVRSFHQDDAHIFMKEDEIGSEILSVLQFADELYTTFGLEYHLELSTRPEKNTIGTDEEWQIATEGLQGALDASGRKYLVNPGDGAFYGPKIDFHIRDALDRTWQCGTIQLDMALPEKFELEYTAQDGTRKRPVMIHRAIFGSIERFLGILIEHFAGKFPLWLSPLQVRLIPVADRHIPYAEKLLKVIQDKGFLADCDKASESVSKKIREAQMNQINYMLTVGDQEVDNQTVSLRTRNNQVKGEMSLFQFLEICEKERDTKSLTSLFEKPNP